MGMAKRIESAEELEKHIEGFIKDCEENKKIPSDYALCKYLSISPTTLERYYQEGITEEEKEKETYKGYSKPLKKLQLFREHRLLQQLETSKGNNTSAIFQLKQKKNGGYMDAPIQAETNASITLKVEGVGGIEAFR